MPPEWSVMIRLASTLLIAVLHTQLPNGSQTKFGPHIDEVIVGRSGQIAVEAAEYNTARKELRLHETSFIPCPTTIGLPPSRSDISQEIHQVGNQGVPTQSKTVSQTMTDFMAKKDFFLDEVLRLEYDPHIKQPCPTCTSPGESESASKAALFRCQECCQGPLLCAECMVECHRVLPFHQIEKWDDGFFKRISLFDLGHLLLLGHNGRVCPQSSTSDIKKLIITHTNGIHKVKLVYCRCVDAGTHIEQLLRARFFPATLVEPRSAFTFSVLRHFHKMSNEAGSVAYGYIQTLQRLTNDVSQDEVPERYREFLNIIRFWTYLQTKKRSGQPQGIHQFLPKAHQHSIAMVCPACPQPGINMAPRWEEEPVDKRHKHTLFLNVDGNFRLSRKDKKEDPNDVSLATGNAYFVEDSAYAAFLKEAAKDLYEEACTCSGFKAGDILRSARGKGTVIPGVVCISCSRHMLLRPKGTVDLQKGERFCNVDYALAHSIKDTVGENMWITLSYDVGCQYCIKLSKRMVAQFPEVGALMNRFTILVPKMHIKAHKEACQPFYSLDLTPHSGQTDGEGGERV
ncbi:hypothetical protein M422DRAFT_255228 [Sphaerobolus stellatus SS14]|uniref:CxC2-like cysteine cluster KDZ transposase-associated domain-containing protein n=1 Tax=Sphaerobolus stellatus (strain SS14) TaxID=990650 RepID=A0A0C9VSZ6_SPHS4|nr:hypothetical protein M422DRAFT_255228 [Sphaerobolus stellatus SS14]